MHRRAFLRSVIVGTLAAPFVTRQVQAFPTAEQVRIMRDPAIPWNGRVPLKTRILQSLKRRSQLGQVSGTIALSYEDFAALDDRARPRQDLLKIAGVPCVGLSELAPNEYLIHTKGLLG
jgi:hypothetical protein